MRLLRRMVRQAKSSGARPILLYLPRADDVVRGEHPPGPMDRACAENIADCLDPTEAIRRFLDAQSLQVIFGAVPSLRFEHLEDARPAEAQMPDQIGHGNGLPQVLLEKGYRRADYCVWWGWRHLQLGNGFHQDGTDPGAQEIGRAHV